MRKIYEIYNYIELFHLKGSIDYSKLNLIHKIMIKIVYEQAKKFHLKNKVKRLKHLCQLIMIK